MRLKALWSSSMIRFWTRLTKCTGRCHDTCELLDFPLSRSSGGWEKLKILVSSGSLLLSWAYVLENDFI